MESGENLKNPGLLIWLNHDLCHACNMFQVYWLSCICAIAAFCGSMLIEQAKLHAHQPATLNSFCNKGHNWMLDSCFLYLCATCMRHNAILLRSTCCIITQHPAPDMPYSGPAARVPGPTPAAPLLPRHALPPLPLHQL